MIEKLKCKDGGTCHHDCGTASNCFRERCCVPLSGSGLDDNWTPMPEPISEPRSLYRLRDKLRQHPPGGVVELSTATLLMLVEELIEARKAK